MSTSRKLTKYQVYFFKLLTSNLTSNADMLNLMTFVGVFEALFQDNFPRGKLPPTPKLTLTETLNLTEGENFPRGQLSGCPPTLNRLPDLENFVNSLLCAISQEVKMG